MSRETAPGTRLAYHLIAFNPLGRERAEPVGVLGSDQARCEIRDRKPTDIFLLCHGWMGDVPAARRQYGSWVAAMAACPDAGAMARGPGGFRPLILGIHWPSLPWGDETLPPSPSGDRVSRFAGRLSATREARHALRAIFSAVDRGPGAALTDDVADAYAALDRETHLGADGAEGHPGNDREPFDPRAIYEAAIDADDGEAPVAGSGLGRVRDALLAPLRTLSFWSMKDRARVVGESGLAALLVRLQREAPRARFHLMGHSFGCIAACSALIGRDAPERPVDSLVLVQGAMSVWSFCSDIPVAPGRAGYFHPIVRDLRVRGPIVATLSEHDRAVGTWYPIAAGAARQVTFAPGYPRHGGIGACGIRGPVARLHDLEIGPEGAAPAFSRRRRVQRGGQRRDLLDARPDRRGAFRLRPPGDRAPGLLGRPGAEPGRPTPREDLADGRGI